MALVGYARVSTVGQSLDVQREKLKDCDKLFEEKESGTNNTRPQLATCPGLCTGRRYPGRYPLR